MKRHNRPILENDDIQDARDDPGIKNNKLMRAESNQFSGTQNSNQAFHSEKPYRENNVKVHPTSDDKTESENYRTINFKHNGTTSKNQTTSEPDFKRELENFYQELDEINIECAGNFQVKFNHNKSLKCFLECLYPDWKKPGKVTSIPCARIPKVFVRKDYSSKCLQKHFNSQRKGDDGEGKIYRFFLKEVATDDGGIIVLPNVNGNHIFKQGGLGSVEIDMIVAHPWKGIFVFNVKNESGFRFGKNKQNDENDWIEKLQSEMLKHTNFIRYLLDYSKLSDQSTTLSSRGESEVTETDTVRIHAVFCYIPDDLSSLTKLADNDANWYNHGVVQKSGLGNVIVFQKSDLKKFETKWKEELEKISSMENSAAFDILVARLVALNSQNGASAVIHQKIVSNELQSFNVLNKNSEVRNRLEQQLSETLPQEEDKECKKKLIKFMKEISTPPINGRRRFFFWTKEQVNVIATVFKGLMKSTNEGMRVMVKGAKGTGKTILMIYLARLAELEFKNQKNGGRVIICNGDRGSPVLLFSQLRLKLKNTGIEFVIDYRKLHETLNNIAENCIVFFDETYFNVHSNFLAQLNKRAHCCVFSSEGRYSAINSFKSLYLTLALRSTSSLQIFFNNLLKNTLSIPDMNGAISHSLIGSNSPDIKIYRASDGCDFKYFWEKCVETVCKYATETSTKLSTSIPTRNLVSEKSEMDKLEILVIFDFLSLKSQLNILSQLKEKNLNLCSASYKNVSGRKNHDQNLPTIRLEPSTLVGGTEFGCVIVLLERSVNISPLNFIRRFFVSATRATTNLAVVATDLASTKTALSIEEIEAHLSQLYDF